MASHGCYCAICNPKGSRNRRLSPKRGRDGQFMYSRYAFKRMKDLPKSEREYTRED